MSSAVVTGSNRGIGLEMARQLVERGFFVYAGCRNPQKADALNQLASSTKNILVLPLDVASESDITHFARSVEKATPSLEMLVNNAGILPDEPNLAAVTQEKMTEAFVINSVAPMLMIQKLRPLLEKGKGKILNVSSGWASMQTGETMGGNSYSYAGSKAALNRLGRSVAIELKPSGVGVYSFEPGWVKTDMAKGGGHYTPQEAVGNVLKVLDGLSLKDSGGYFNWKGERHPW
jgi:NAD(P)-dependent dehydrogenase (short-subunit alcohol dehydrogenase family)